jgi:hypothetical protein
MAGLSDFHAEGVTDLDSYNLGVIAERERITESLMRVRNQYAVTSAEHLLLDMAIAIVKGGSK